MKTNSILLSVVSTFVALTTAAQPQPIVNRPRHVEGELLVKFRGGPRGVAAEQARGRMQHEVTRHFDFIGWQHIRLPMGMTVEEGLARYRNLPGVEAVEPNSVGQWTEPAPVTPMFRPAGEAPPASANDPLFSQQWGLEKIGATNAWAVTTGSSNVVVVIPDSGVNYNHEDLHANMWRNPSEIPGNGIDDDGNGYRDDVYGIDTASNDSDPMDEGIVVSLFGLTLHYHGTACSGIIGAVGNNGVGLTGINWSVQIMALRVTLPDNSFLFADLVEGLNYVYLMKSRGVNVRVISMSFGAPNISSQIMKDAMDRLATQGVLQVAAAGNYSLDIDTTTFLPAGYNTSNLIAVAASDPLDALAGFSDYGRTNVDLAAPGVDIVMLSGEATNAYYSPGHYGTSFSTPHVAGAAALLFAANPGATAAEVKAALLDTVDVLPAFTNKMVSNGRLNVGRAMTHPAIAPNSPPFIAAPPQNRTANEGTNASFVVTAYGTRPLFYQWQRQGEALAGRTNSALAVTNLTAAHAGDYWVVVSNAFGMATSAVATLTVRTIPRLVGPLPPLQLTAVAGETVTLSVETTGTLPIGYRWRHLRTNGTAANLTIFVLNQNTCFVTLTADVNSAGTYTIILTNIAQPTSSIQRTNSMLAVLADADGDGLPDAWELAHGFPTNDASNAALDADCDLDGLTNLQEYRAGTDPQDAQSYLRVENISRTRDANAVALRFVAAANKTYTIQHRPAANSGAWTRLADFAASPTNRLVEVLDADGPPIRGQRFYRLVLPRVP